MLSTVRDNDLSDGLVTKVDTGLMIQSVPRFPAEHVNRLRNWLCLQSRRNGGRHLLKPGIHLSALCPATPQNRIQLASGIDNVCLRAASIRERQFAADECKR